jgi:hypothetical protein
MLSVTKMQTKHIIHLLRTQETKLQSEIRKTQKGTSKDSLTALRLLFMQSNCKLSINICNALWAMHLLKTSISVTGTPLTTLKSLSKVAINQSFATI